MANVKKENLKTCSDEAIDEAYNFIKIETLAQVFPVNFVKFLRTPFLTEHAWATASDYFRKNAPPWTFNLVLDTP